MGTKKLTGDDVATIRALYAFFPTLKQRGIAQLYGIRQATVSRIVTRRARRYIK